MEPESMVHALEQIHDLLNPGGYLIDIHPNGELVEFMLPLDGQEHLIGFLQETDDYIEYRQADEAIASSIKAGWFGLEKSGEFDFHTYADSFEELKVFIDETWSDAYVTDEVLAKAKMLEKDHGRNQVFMREHVHIGLLKTD